MTLSAHQIALPEQVEAEEAFAALSSTPNAQLIDVRTVPEWSFVGVPNLATLQKEAQLLSWRTYPQMEVNGTFITQLEAAIPDKTTPLYFLCKLGGRSQEAALAASQAGYAACHNITHGFDGDLDAQGHRGTLNGWRGANLPWEQA